MLTLSGQLPPCTHLLLSFPQSSVNPSGCREGSILRSRARTPTLIPGCMLWEVFEPHHLSLPHLLLLSHPEFLGKVLDPREAAFTQAGRRTELLHPGHCCNHDFEFSP